MGFLLEVSNHIDKCFFVLFVCLFVCFKQSLVFSCVVKVNILASSVKDVV